MFKTNRRRRFKKIQKLYISNTIWSRLRRQQSKIENSEPICGESTADTEARVVAGRYGRRREESGRERCSPVTKKRNLGRVASTNSADSR